MYTYNQEEYEKRTRWFTDARFGMFLHWGLYAIPARGEWMRSFEKKTEEDLVGEYVEAVRAEGLKVGLYYSLLDWHHEDYPHFSDSAHPMYQNPACPDEGRVWERYLEYLHNQVRELCSNYGKLDVLWFDYSFGEYSGEKWGATKLVDMVHDADLKTGGVCIKRRQYAAERRSGCAGKFSGTGRPYSGSDRNVDGKERRQYIRRYLLFHAPAGFWPHHSERKDTVLEVELETECRNIQGNG